ncbi:heparinase II/III domain-containing protein [Pelagerythrobacter marensis]|uniref:Alginate lyase n=1 Tax=Pelagerythrobacter marensis TaxID=543877 RepID=A0A0G3X9C8_9SPHN|nr:heparinase II/III family protein [Pelagerythrobacter marensis]AKM07802.1 Alginate lyase [Pelagerythrobacter marensis]
MSRLLRRAASLATAPVSALALALALTASGAPLHAQAAAEASPVGENMPPLYADEFARARAFVGEMMEAGVVVPQPRDPGGGYTHEQHKRNYRAILLAGQLYRITGDRPYADYVREMLLAYADLYPTLGEHPARSNQYSGRLFWQVLNDAVWLVHAVQGYAEIRDTLTAADRERIDSRVFRPAAHFLSVESQSTFDRIHNHATWATAGVGMTGYLLGDRDMVDRALLGSDKSGEAGFLRQTELLFSPDGYYAEGPYYQRYALMPFMVFADAIARNDPDRRIFEHRDGILLKALRTTVQLTYGGYFFPFNDAMKDKSLRTEELYHGIAIAYAQTRDPALLSIAQMQDRTVLTPAGQLVAADLAAGRAEPFPFRSMLLRDGPQGEQGAVAILREGEGPRHTALVAKNSSQGMGHGHFDKLSWQLYDNGHEIVRDYGAARFLNIEAKQGGRYLPENETWAKQTVAHNALVVDRRSHFDGKVKPASAVAPEQLHFSDEPGLQVTSARVDGAYTGVGIVRTLVMADVPGLESPVVFDLVTAESDAPHSYDLPLHYQGAVIELGFPVESHVAARPVLGEDHGYQHVWVDATGRPDAGDGALTWLLDGRFYTYRFATDGATQAILGQVGANDPEFNLRREPLILLRREGAGGTTFATLLESHGRYDGAAEQTVASRSRVAAMRHHRQGGKDIVVLTLKDGGQVALAVSHDADPAARHRATIDGQQLAWTGFAAIVEIGRGGN